MTVAELIEALKEMPQDLTVMAAGENAEKVIVETCEGYSYVRIFEPWNVEFVLSPAIESEVQNDQRRVIEKD